MKIFHFGNGKKFVFVYLFHQKNVIDLFYTDAKLFSKKTENLTGVFKLKKNKK